MDEDLRAITGQRVARHVIDERGLLAVLEGVDAERGLAVAVAAVEEGGARGVEEVTLLGGEAGVVVGLDRDLGDSFDDAVEVDHEIVFRWTPACAGVAVAAAAVGEGVGVGEAAATVTSSLSGGKGCLTSLRSAIAKMPVVRFDA